MTTATVDAPTGAALAPWSRRVLAALVDGAVLFVVSSLLLLAVGARPLWAFGHNHLSAGQLALRYLVVIGAALLYYPPLMRLTDTARRSASGCSAYGPFAPTVSR